MGVRGAGAVTSEQATTRFAEVLRVPIFRIIYAAELQSAFGDQLARVALSVLVFARTGSDSATALTYGLTYLPAVVGGVVLSRVGDRWPRRRVMVACDVLRAIAFAVMSIPGLPLVAVSALLCVAVFVGPAFTASAGSFLVAELTQGEFRAASGIRMSSNQLIQVAGFAAGGLLVTGLGARGTLLLNAGTYVVSAAALTWGLRHRRRALEVDAPAGSSGQTGPEPAPHGVLRTVWRDATARSMLLLSLLVGVFIVPESLAIPFAVQIGATTAQAGLLLASIPFGAVCGIVVVTRLVPPQRRTVVAWAMAVGTGLPLVATAATDRLWLAALCWFASGAASAYLVEAIIVLVNATTDASRATLISLISSMLLGSQGIGPIVFGLVAAASSPAASITSAGLAGTAGAVAVVARARGLSARTGTHRSRG